ncbi:DISARM system SNF2-like helicase DrmD [Klebsiella pneumoniae]|uniref:DISARM system SNF2-like helicase DrmD n=2 Tax=Klebsiella pneumoniae TaxID=573 RepID=UPI000DE679B6|nr:DISARM system SNF2-like helicase DrmD [Klebsiella pneumoniae]KAB1514919.1 DEAD/DEAH box helicase [Klebsiella pneumoniae]MDG0605027.1 DISARM system SNF2-like helicase DrmD [Klebsiella pneumoniae]SSK89740.1 helicase domain-containing protein [Klebsiella pneumoniae]
MDISNQKNHPQQIIPEPGQLVEVRRRQWIVVEVSSSQLPPPSSQQHLITLSSIDEDGLGELLEVIWEIELGAQVIERAGLPSITGLDDSDTLEAFLDAVRWGAVTKADHRNFLQAPFRSGVSIEDFQLDPLVRAIDMARVNLLIADDVGLGKTIEAGLIIQEMLLRHRARTVLIVCPASLQEKWRVEMLEKFGLEFQIVDTAYIKRLRRERGIHANPWTSHPRLITSMDWAKSGEGLRSMRDVLPLKPSYPRKFDMLVIDEAHNIAPVGRANYAMESQRTRFIRSISPHFQHRLFLTATPHNGYTESFTSLLELLDDQRFARNVLPDEKLLNQVMIRRLKSDLVDSEGNPLYAQRKLKALSVEYSAQERSIHKKLDEYCHSREQGAEKASNTFGTTFVNQLLKKRLFSSPAAFASTLERHISTLMHGKRPNDKNAMADRILHKAILRLEEDYADDQEIENAQSEAVEEATHYTQPLTNEQKQILDVLRQWAQVAKNQVDSKAKAILDWINTNLKTNNQWNEYRVILFTEYRTTHQWMHEILASHGLAGERLAVLHGSMPQEEREKVKAAFQTSPKASAVRILLATDAASEGIDLQNYCNYLIHLEIPYNPNVMEQRNGRIDRHGQRQKEVVIWHPVDGVDKVNARIGGHGDDILRALRKLESMRADMGSVNPVIAPQMSGLIEGTIKDFDTRLAEARIAKTKRFIGVERELKERIAKLHERLLSARQELHLTPEHIQIAVNTALMLAGRTTLEPFELHDAPSGSVFRIPALSGTWARCLEGLRHPHTQEIRPVTFDHSVAKGRDDVVLVHLNHLLVQMCLRLLRAEIWARDDIKKLHRVTVRSVPDMLLESPAVAVVSRLVITGGNHHRLHEELTIAGGYLGDKNFRREDGVNKLQQWFEQAKPVTTEFSLLDAFRMRFERAQNSILQSVEARSKDRLQYLTNTLQTRKERELSDINNILNELEITIKSELAKDQQPMQFSLFSEDERAQIKRDNAALEARLARIPAEREQEVQTIELRYTNIDDRTFPVAVIFLVPESTIQRGAA